MAEFDITAKITAVLTEYSTEIQQKVNKAADDCGKGLTKEIKKLSPRRKNRGDYAKSWTHKKDMTGPELSVTVYNAEHYQLTHLLEKGHKGPSPAKAYPHIAQANEKWQEEFERRCEEAVKG